MKNSTFRVQPTRYPAFLKNLKIANQKKTAKTDLMGGHGHGGDIATEYRKKQW